MRQNSLLASLITLTANREDDFVIGRTELYSIKALDIDGPISTVFVMFRPTALSRVLRFDAEGDGWVREAEREAMPAAMRDSPPRSTSAGSQRVANPGAPAPTMRVRPMLSGYLTQ